MNTSKREKRMNGLTHIGARRETKNIFKKIAKTADVL